jgi:hypothetical protein
MAHARAVQAAASRGVERVALDQKMVARAGRRGAPRRPHDPPGRQSGAASPSARLVVESALHAAHAHAGWEVRQPVRQPRAGHGEERRGLERPEENAGLPVRAQHVGPEIRLEESEGQGPRHAHGPRVLDAEGNRGDPRLPPVQVQLEVCRDPRTQCRGWHRPVQEQEVAPPLIPDGTGKGGGAGQAARAHRQRPVSGTVITSKRWPLGSSK